MGTFDCVRFKSYPIQIHVLLLVKTSCIVAMVFFAISSTPIELNTSSLKALSPPLIFSLSLKSKTKKYETTMHIFPLLTNWYVAVCVWSCELEWVGNELFRAAAGVFLAALFHVLYCMH